MDHVVSAGSVNAFKDRFDKFMCNMDISYDYSTKYNGASSNRHLNVSDIINQ